MEKKIYGLLGERLSHSFSPMIHKSFGKYDYSLFEVPEDGVESFLKKPDLGGLNVTIPYKRKVIPFCDELSETARRIGAVNTLIFAENRIYGDNTDYHGFAFMLEDSGICVRDKKVMVLGSGGTSLTAQAVLRDMGAKEITVVSRSGEHNYSNLPRDAEIIVNTTPVGMFPGNLQSLVDLDRFPDLCGVADVIYNPLCSKLLLDAKSRGIKCTNGLSMLVYQAKTAGELFIGSPIAESEVKRIIGEISTAYSNISLVGMAGSGKTTIGKLIADSLGLEFVDIDKVIEESAKITIPEIFACYGEPRFRELERQHIADYGKRHGYVISAGGGAALCEQNVNALSQNGTVFLIDRDPNLLDMKGRPLSSSREAVIKLYDSRLPSYLNAADYVASNNSSIGECLNSILEVLYENHGYKRR